uniref:Uncharacterized protein n=1 Tax=Glossina austeni TaxID=7395 RepID=A0A1A9V4N5_GLOAU
MELKKDPKFQNNHQILHIHKRNYNSNLNTNIPIKIAINDIINTNTDIKTGIRTTITQTYPIETILPPSLETTPSLHIIISNIINSLKAATTHSTETATIRTRESRTVALKNIKCYEIIKIVIPMGTIMFSLAFLKTIYSRYLLGREQLDHLGGTENTATAGDQRSEEKAENGTSISNAVVMQFMQQMQRQTQQVQQQVQQHIQSGQQEIESKIDGRTEKIEKIQENQGILQTHINEVYRQFESKVNVLEGRVGNALDQLDVRMNSQEKDADALRSEIKALKKEMAKLQTNDITTYL